MTTPFGEKFVCFGCSIIGLFIKVEAVEIISSKGFFFSFSPMSNITLLTNGNAPHGSGKQEFRFPSSCREKVDEAENSKKLFD